MSSSIKHHLPDELLMAYAAGTLPEAFSLVVASHISMCDTCRAAAEGFDAVGGEMLEQAGEVTVEAQSLDQVMARISGAAAAGDRAVSRPSLPPDTTGEAPVLPAPLRDYIGGDVDAIRWRRVGGGVKQAILPTSKSASARLLFIPSGAAVPDHGHNGTELTLVLRGAFQDETDHFGRGDVEVADEDLNHTPVADIGADCICLAATDAPLKFNAFLPRIAQRFLRI